MNVTGDHTDLGNSSYRDGDAVASVDFIALHVQSQGVEGNPGETSEFIIQTSSETVLVLKASVR